MFTISDHAVSQAKAKGFTAEEIFAAMTNPARVTDVLKYPGQKRFIAGRIAVVAAPKGDAWHIVTLYLDDVLTAPRADQMDTPEGRRYAERFANGQGRG